MTIVNSISIDDLLQDSSKCMNFLQEKKEDLEVQKRIEVITCIIRRILGNHQYISTGQTLLNLAFRTYFQLREKHRGDDSFDKFLANQEKQLEYGNESSFQILYATLISNQKKRNNANSLEESCHKAFVQAVEENKVCLLLILKTLNLLIRKHPELEVNIKLSQIYTCLLSHQTGMREEVLTFFTYCCRDATLARQYFQFVVHFYPWTCRNKYYMLSCILTDHNLLDFLENSEKDLTQFFCGLKLSLSFKRLLPSSQYLVKTLSNQNSVELLNLSATILTNGSSKEIRNFYAQWFGRIGQKDKLFEFLQQKPEINYVLANFGTNAKVDEAYRFILIFSMYSRHILETSKLHFFTISTELITNCFHFESDAQFLIFKFVVDNMNCFALEDCLEFLSGFLQHQKTVENPQIRNSILGKIPHIINYISKCFWKTQKFEEFIPSTLKSSVEVFFGKLHKIINDDIGNDVYQPKIFALKLLEILVKSLYLPKLQKNAKNCSVAQNSFLGEFLIVRGIFNSSEITSKLIDALHDPLGYDDALDLIVDLLQKIHHQSSKLMLDLCRKCAQSAVIEECALSGRFAKCILGNIDGMAYASNLYPEAFSILKSEATSFQNDPLLACKTRHHLFGFLDVINVILSGEGHSEEHINNDELLDLLENIENMILQFLNVSCTGEQFCTAAASFQDMDESLEELVVRSAYESNNHEESRKFLLMSFWLTLKSCCDVATTLGCLLSSSYQAEWNLKMLQRCLDIIVIVLTRCRHKGAIEAAGLSIGKLTKHLTSRENNSEIKNMLCECLFVLLDNGKRVSTTRRGAGYSIMFLHVVKNDAQFGHPLLRHVIKEIFDLLRLEAQTLSPRATNCDRIEALTLHYLCVLVKDADLREPLNEYLDEIMLAAIAKIENSEWTICNAALQLFGALIPKIVGQRQATEFEQPPEWEPIEVTYTKIIRDLPKTFEYILNYCTDKASKNSSTRSIILFLEFLSKIEHLEEDDMQRNNETKMLRLRSLLWSLLRHKCEKVRKLSGLCYVRSHEFRCELPQALLMASDLIFTESDENFFEGLLFFISEGVLKIKNEGLHTISMETIMEFHETLQSNLVKNFSFKESFKFYTATKTLEMLLTVGFSKQSNIINALIKSVDSGSGLKSKNKIGYEEWCEKVKEVNE